MRRIIPLLLAAVLGAGSYMAYHRYIQPEKAGKAEQTEPTEPTEGPEMAHVPPALPVNPILAEDAADEEAGGAAPIGERPATPAEGSPPPAEPTAPLPAPSFPAASTDDLESAIARARLASASKDPATETRILREIWQLGKGRADANIVPYVRQLLDIERRGANDRPAAPGGSANAALRAELWRYIDERDTDPAWKAQACLALGTAESTDPSPEVLRSAWSRLSRAYLGASTPAERKAVLEVLTPFVEKQVFSGRFSPLVETYPVKSGDSLNKIAKLKGTTEDALIRLNKLKGTVIHPGNRLIILTGKPKIFVKKSEFRMWVTLGTGAEERVLGEWPVGLGKENKTPAANFTINIRQKEPIWYRPGEPPIPYGDKDNILGSRWLGFKNTDDLRSFGIHGTSDPASIGQEASAGCIRMRNEDLERLFDLIPTGTEVEIRE